MQQIGYSKMAVNLVDMVADYCDSVIDQVHHISLRKLIFPKCRDTLKNQFFMYYLNFIIPATSDMNKILIISDICSKKLITIKLVQHGGSLKIFAWDFLNKDLVVDKNLKKTCTRW